MGFDSNKTPERLRQLDAKTDEFAYGVAALAWEAGLTANVIAKRIYGSSDAHCLMKVKRALARAHNKFLAIKPPVAEGLQDDLSKVFNDPSRLEPLRFHVVEDAFTPAFSVVCDRAAELLSEIIDELLKREDSPDGPQEASEVIIANAGGHTVAQMVKYLARRSPHRSASSLKFVAGNSAYRPDSFDLSASFLSVTMAELFGSTHLAMPLQAEPSQLETYLEYVSRSKLFICGVGVEDHSLMAMFLDDHGWPMPSRAVGDLAFNLIDKHGNAVVPEAEEVRNFIRRVNPAMGLERIGSIAAVGRVLMILDADQPESKTRVSIAALQSNYATDVVLGSRLALSILRRLSP